MALQDSFLDEDTKILHPRRLRGKKLFLAWLVWFFGTTFYIGALGYFIPAELSTSRSGRVDPKFEIRQNKNGAIYFRNLPDESGIGEDCLLTHIQTSHHTYAVQPGWSIYRTRRLWYGTVGSVVDLVFQCPNQPQIKILPVTLSEDLNIALTQLGWSYKEYDRFIFGLDLTFILITAGVGLLLAWRKPYDWLALYASLTLIAMATSQSLLLQQATLGTNWHFILFGPPLALVHFSFYIFPDGKLPARWAIVPAICMIAYYLLRMAFQWSGLAKEIDLGFYFFEIGILSYRYRKTTSPIERMQIKWVIWGFGLAVAGVFLPILIHESQLWELTNTKELSTILWEFFLQPITKLSVGIPAVTLVIAMLRTGLWRIDYFISRSTAYGVVVIGLGLSFIVGLWGLTQIIRQLEIDLWFLYLVIGFLLFFLILGFVPARRLLQGWVDKTLFGIRIPYMAEQPHLPRLEFARPIFSAYKDLTLIGSGGMSEVYRAWHESERQMVAIKILARNLPSHLDYRTRFLREASLLKSFEHPNIIHIFEYGEIDDTPYLVMEYMDGGSLSEFLHRNSTFTLQQALPMLSALASALDYIHARGILHRDIKPQNIMLKGSQPVLMDFGIAKRLNNTISRTPADLLGTVNYMSPEQIQADPEIGVASDLYSFGVLAYQMLTGQLPFRYNNAGAVLLAHINQPPPNPCEINPHLPPMAGIAIQRILAKQPALRFASAGEFVEALQRAAINVPASA